MGKAVIYIFVFLCSAFLFRITENRKGNFVNICHIIAIALPALLAMFRADQIGIDVLVYVKRFFFIACNSSTFTQYRHVINTEFGYKLLNYVVSRLTHQLCVLHLCNQLLMLMPIYLAVKKLKNIVPLWLGMLAYYLMFYNVSLNVVRQGIACAWLFYAFVSWWYKEYKKSLGFLIVAISFHITALFGGAILGGVLFLIRREKINKVALFALFVAAIIVSYNYLTIIEYILQYFPRQYITKFTKYLYTEQVTSGIGITYLFTRLLCIGILVLLCLEKKYIYENRCLLIVEVFSIMFIPIAVKIDFGYRLLRYLDLCSIVIIPELLLLANNRKINRLICEFIAVTSMLVFWIITYVIRNNGGTIPYKLA